MILKYFETFHLNIPVTKYKFPNFKYFYTMFNCCCYSKIVCEKTNKPLLSNKNITDIHFHLMSYPKKYFQCLIIKLLI